MQRTHAGERPSVAIVGAGRVGTAIGRLLADAGHPIRHVVSRSRERAQEAVATMGVGTPETDVARAAHGAEIVLVTVPDQAVAETARTLAGGGLDAGVLLVHTSGALEADVLRVPGAERALCVSIHPIQTVADRTHGAESLRGAYFGIEGSAEAVAAGETLVRAIGGRPLVVAPGAKAMYHAAACVASNYLVTLIDASLTMYEHAGIARCDAIAALVPLLHGTLANVERLGVPDALTGPIERGDTQTVRAHLDALTQTGDGELERLYRLVGLYTLRLAQAKAGRRQERGALLDGRVRRSRRCEARCTEATC